MNAELKKSTLKSIIDKGYALNEEEAEKIMKNLTQHGFDFSNELTSPILELAKSNLDSRKKITEKGHQAFLAKVEAVKNSPEYAYELSKKDYGEFVKIAKHLDTTPEEILEEYYLIQYGEDVDDDGEVKLDSKKLAETLKKRDNEEINKAKQAYEEEQEKIKLKKEENIKQNFDEVYLEVLKSKGTYSDEQKVKIKEEFEEITFGSKNYTEEQISVLLSKVLKGFTSQENLEGDNFLSGINNQDQNKNKKGGYTEEELKKEARTLGVTVEVFKAMEGIKD